jgi:hypothetical protein
MVLVGEDLDDAVHQVALRDLILAVDDLRNTANTDPVQANFHTGCATPRNSSVQMRVRTWPSIWHAVILSRLDTWRETRLQRCSMDIDTPKSQKHALPEVVHFYLWITKTHRLSKPAEGELGHCLLFRDPASSASPPLCQLLECTKAELGWPSLSFRPTFQRVCGRMGGAYLF